MKRTAAILTLLALASAAMAAFFVEVPANGSPAEVRPGGRAAWVSGVATNGYAPALSVVRESWAPAADVAEHAWTNFTYSVSYTNTVWSGTNATVVVATNTAPRPFRNFPATMTGYWTNATVRTWAETNWVPRLAYATTNAVTAGTTWIAPGDKVRVTNPPPAGGRVTLAVED